MIENNRVFDKTEFTRATEYAMREGFALKAFYQHCIRYGNPSEIDAVLERVGNDPDVAQALGDNVEFVRLSFLYSWAQMELAAVWGGLQEEDAAALYFEFAQIAMEEDSLEGLMRLNRQLLHDYAAAVEGMNRSLGRYKPVHVCKQYIDERLYEDLNASIVAEQLHFNVDYLSRLFREAEGLSLAAYIRNRKLEESAILLKSTSMGIAEISACLGFSSQSHFTSLFGKTFGMTPKQWRMSVNAD